MLSLNAYDYVRIVAGIVMMAVLAFQKPKHFILADALLGLTASGVSFFAPRIWNSQVSVPFDGLHIFMQQSVACMALLPAVFYIFFARNAKDDDGLHGLLGCRTVGVGLATIVFALSHWRHPGIFNEQQFSLMLTGHLMWFGLVIQHLYQSGLNAPKQSRSNPINLYIKIDIGLFALAGLCDLLFPSMLSYFLVMKLDYLHEFQISLFGVANLAGAAFGVYALGFRNVSERRGYLWCRIVVLILLAICHGYNVLTKRVVMNVQEMVVFCSLYPPAVVAYVGLALTGGHRLFTASTGYNLRSGK